MQVKEALKNLKKHEFAISMGLGCLGTIVSLATLILSIVAIVMAYVAYKGAEKSSSQALQQSKELFNNQMAHSDSVFQYQLSINGPRLVPSFLSIVEVSVLQDFKVVQLNFEVKNHGNFAATNISTVATVYAHKGGFFFQPQDLLDTSSYVLEPGEHFIFPPSFNPNLKKYQDYWYIIVRLDYKDVVLQKEETRFYYYYMSGIKDRTFSGWLSDDKVEETQLNIRKLYLQACWSNPIRAKDAFFFKDPKFSYLDSIANSWYYQKYLPAHQ